MKNSKKWVDVEWWHNNIRILLMQESKCAYSQISHMMFKGMICWWRLNQPWVCYLFLFFRKSNWQFTNSEWANQQKKKIIDPHLASNLEISKQNWLEKINKQVSTKSNFDVPQESKYSEKKIYAFFFEMTKRCEKTIKSKIKKNNTSNKCKGCRYLWNVTYRAENYSTTPTSNDFNKYLQTTNLSLSYSREIPIFSLNNRIEGRNTITK